MFKSYEDNSLYKLLRNKNDIMETTNSIGLISTVAIDFAKTKAGFEEQIELNISDEPVIEINEENKEEYNVTEIDFETLKNNESDPAVKTLHNYFNHSNNNCSYYDLYDWNKKPNHYWTLHTCHNCNSS